MTINLLKGDCLLTMKTLPDNSVDSIVTDPPYGLSFMGKKWDYDVPSVDIWKECLRVLKPGGHLLAFFGTRTYHRGVVRIEDAGFEIRDQIMWIYGSGFPKSHNIGKAIDKAAGAEREVIGVYQSPENTSGKSDGSGSNFGIGGLNEITAPATDAAKQWDGWGTALKPANEPIVVARKPLEKGLTIAENVVKWGTGAINVDASRISTDEIKESYEYKGKNPTNILANRSTYQRHNGNGTSHNKGRWPANILFDEEAAAVLDEQSGTLKSGKLTPDNNVKESSGWSGGSQANRVKSNFESNSGGASRFFYVAKASKSERNKGLEGMPEKAASGLPMRSKDGDRGGEGIDGTDTDRLTKNQNFHPTVKPVKLMQYLIKLVTPPKGTVLDPFMGSGSTGVAARELGFNFIGCELSDDYFEIAKKRIE